MDSEGSRKLIQTIIELHRPKSYPVGIGGIGNKETHREEIPLWIDPYTVESTEQVAEKEKTEFVNAPLVKIKERILEFKQTRSMELFSQLIFFRFERFLFWICRKFQTKYSFLRNIPIDDLYHAAIIATYKSFISMPADWKLELVLQRIKSYVRQDFFTLFNDKVALESDRLEPHHWECLERKATQDLEDRINCFLILDSLSAEDRDLLVKKFIENRTYESLRQEYDGISKQALSARVCKILKKIRRVIDKP